MSAINRVTECTEGLSGTPLSKGIATTKANDKAGDLQEWLLQDFNDCCHLIIHDFIKVIFGLTHNRLVELKVKMDDKVMSDPDFQVSWKKFRESVKVVRSEEPLTETPGRRASNSEGQDDEDMLLSHMSSSHPYTRNVCNKRQKTDMGAVQRYREDEDEDEDESITTTQGMKVETLVQCANYRLEMLSRGILQYHALGLVVDGTWFQCCYYDRSAIIHSNPINLDEKDHLLLLLVALNELKVHKPFVSPIPDRTPGTTEVFPHMDPVYCNLKGHDDHYELASGQEKGLVHDRSGMNAFHGCKLVLDEETELTLGQTIQRSHSIIGRGTTVLHAKCLKGHWGKEGDEVVVKISFVDEGRLSEAKFMDLAKEKAVGDHAWALEHLPEILSAHEYPNSKDSPESRLFEFMRDKLKADSTYELRILRILVLRPLKSITQLDDPKDFAQVFYDILQIHRWLVDHAKILHRDISQNNIMYRVLKDGKVHGVLNDLDLASTLSMSRSHSSQTRSGTRPFMSHELLTPNRPGLGHFYRHDLESIYYVMLILFANYDKVKEDGNAQKKGIQKVDNQHEEWFKGTDKEVAAFKWIALNSVPTLQPLFSSLRQSIRQLSVFIRSGHNEAYTYITQEEEEVTFDEHTLNGHVTYDKFRAPMSRFRGEPLVTRYKKPLDLVPVDYRS
ncbi:hypothetical protein D9758_010216 [Tetrapyrgos nigripes]|uniref:Protein kinase domain-containing protein n=1 Tax=Tetrapyrgos nigripes TaxID=182062 RepID=A0A8H5CZ48_9AGAR|nr:hypothetical protein D9758_010216 [Tetrapyrgos nigripes]